MFDDGLIINQSIDSKAIQRYRHLSWYYMRSQEKKGVFLRFLKVAGKIFITTVSKKNFQKKVTTTMVDFNNKFLND